MFKFLKTWWNALVQRANEVWSTKVKPAVKEAWEQFSDEFADLAFDTVRDLALSTLSGNQKFDVAVKTVLDTAEKRGWQIGTSAVQLLVQRAYVNYKAESESLVVVPPVD